MGIFRVWQDSSSGRSARQQVRAPAVCASRRALGAVACKDDNGGAAPEGVDIVGTASHHLKLSAPMIDSPASDRCGSTGKRRQRPKARSSQPAYFTSSYSSSRTGRAAPHRSVSLSRSRSDSRSIEHWTRSLQGLLGCLKAKRSGPAPERAETAEPLRPKNDAQSQPQRRVVVNQVMAEHRSRNMIRNN